MIGSLHGIVDEIEGDVALVNVNGVGYEVTIGSNFAIELKVGDELSLYTHLSISNERVSLLGFSSKDELGVFKKLIGVNGVGTKVAMALIDHNSMSDMAESFRTQSVQVLTNTPGIGKKTAERIVLEMKNHLDLFQSVAATSSGGVRRSAVVQQALAGLMGLGYNRRQAEAALELSYYEGIGTEDLIRETLRKLAVSS